MNREEAEALCAKNAAEHPDRKIAQWVAREEPSGEWVVVRVGIPAQDTTEEIRADERPPTPDDPRSSQMRDIGPYTGFG
jgi:hypothetical protein